MKKQLIHMIVFLILFVITISGCLNRNQNDYIATVEGEKISLEEFKVYLYIAQQEFEKLGDEDIWDTSFEAGLTAEEAAKERALDSLVHVKISAKQAKRLNISLSEEQKEQAKLDASNFLGSLTNSQLQNIGITEEKMLKIMEEKAIYKEVYEEVTKNFEISEKDFQNSYKAYISKKDNLSILDLSDKLNIEYIFISPISTDKAQNNILNQVTEILQKAKGGKDFKQLVNEYSNSNEIIINSGIETIEKGKYIEKLEDVAFNLKQGEVSDLIIVDSDYYIIKLNDRIESNIKEEYRNKYIKQKKDEIFEQEYNSWKTKEPEKNIELWNSIKKID